MHIKKHGGFTSREELVNGLLTRENKIIRFTNKVFKPNMDFVITTIKAKARQNQF